MKAVCSLALIIALAVSVRAEEVRVTTPMTPPAWALLEREVLRANAAACQEFFHKYFDERGYLQCVERWGGDDGPDDAVENFNRWPELHAMGADDEILQMYLKGWEGHLKQYTAAKTTQVPIAIAKFRDAPPRSQVAVTAALARSTTAMCPALGTLT